MPNSINRYENFRNRPTFNNKYNVPAPIKQVDLYLDSNYDSHITPYVPPSPKRDYIIEHGGARSKSKVSPGITSPVNEVSQEPSLANL